MTDISIFLQKKLFTSSNTYIIYRFKVEKNE